MTQNQKDEQQLEINRRHHEEIYRNQLLDVITEKCPPGLGRWFAATNHILRDRCLRYVNSQLEQFAMDPRRSPGAASAA